MLQVWNPVPRELGLFNAVHIKHVGLLVETSK